jgi:DNA-binding beta-propeller fold protein YncE
VIGNSSTASGNIAACAARARPGSPARTLSSSATRSTAQTITSFSAGLFHGIKGFSPNGIAVGPDGTVYVDTFYGNGFTDQTAIASISPSGATSQVLWEAPMGQ